MNTRSGLVLLLFCFSPWLSFGASYETTTFLSLTNNEAGGRQVRLDWNSSPGARHRVSASTNLTGGMWREVELYESRADNGFWLDPLSATNLQFYSVSDPEPEVFDMDPPVIHYASGSSSYIYGQFIPTNASLEIVTESGDGAGPTVMNAVSTYSLNLIAETTGIWRVDFPSNIWNAGTVMLSAAIVDGSGAVIAPIKIDVGVANAQRANDAPAGTPIAAPQPWHESSARHAIDRKGHGPKRTPAPGLPGEVAFNEVDLDMETPAGPPLRWVRTYRSKFPVSSGHGEGWDFNYNISIQSVDGGTTNARSLLLRDGSGRMDYLHRGTDGIYRADGLFREGQFEGSVFVLVFADKGVWRFNPLTSAVEPARIHQITDRFNVSLTCSYDANGQLVHVHDDFGRSLSVQWSNDRMILITNHVGQTVAYDYDTSGMLMMAMPPGSHTMYSYSGNNLANITDGEGRILEDFTYSTQTNPAAPDFDTIRTHGKSFGGTAVVEVVTFGPVPAGIRAPGGYTMFLNDELGRLTEAVYDARHRPVRMRKYTGFCAPGQPVSATENRPANRLRPEDPEFFETTFAYNIDHALTRITHPDGSGFSMVYERDINPSANARERGNMRTASMIPREGGKPVKVSFTYQPGFGAPESARPGNPIKGIIVKGGKNPGGDIVASPNARSGNPIGGISVKGGKNPGGSVASGRAANQTGGGISFPSGGPAIEAASNPVPGIGIVVKHTPNCTGCKRCRNNSARSAYPPELSEGDHDEVQLPALLRNLLGYDTSDESIGMPVSMARDGLLWRWQYNEDGALTRCDSPIAGSSLEAEYNDKGQCTLTRQIDGTNAYVSSIQYDPDGGFPSTISEQHGLYTSTARYFYNSLGRLTNMIDPAGGESLYDYNEAGQLARCESPVVGGNRIQQTIVYDNAGFLRRMDIEHRDENGNAFSSNPAYSTLIQRDERGRIVRELIEERPSNPNYSINTSDYHVVEYTYDAAGQIVRVRTPAESLDQLHDQVCDYVYDERGFLYRVIAGGSGALESVTHAFDYDHYGNLAWHAIITGGVVAAEQRFEYDGFQRTIKTKDAGGNLSVASYGERGLVTLELYGELNDVPGTNNNVLLYRSRSRGVGGALPGTVETGGGPGKDRVAGTDGDVGTDVLHGDFVSLASGLSAMAQFGVGDYLKHSRTAEATRNPGGIGSGAKAAFDDEDGEAVTSPAHARGKTSGAKGNIGAVTSGHRVAPGFLLWPVEDDVIEIDRFMPGSTVSSGTITNRIDRSPAGLPLRELVNNETIYAYGYDAFGDLIRISNVAQRVDLTKDNAGRITAITRTDHYTDGVTLSQSFTYHYGYDALGRITSITDGAGNQQSLAYDSIGRPVRFTDATGFIRQYEYDGANGTTSFSWRVIGDLNGDGYADVVLSSALARGGQIRRVWDANGYETSFVRDALGRLVRTDYPDGTHEMFAYDGRGYLSQFTKQDGTVIAYESNPLGAIYRANPVIVGPPQANTADQSYTYNGRGQLTGIHITGGPSIIYEYDSWGNLITDQQQYGTVSNTYDHRGRTGYISSADGFRVTEQRDALGRLTSISRNGEPVAMIIYAGNRLHQSIAANGVITTYEYAGDVAAGQPLLNHGFDEISRIVVASGTETNEELRVYDGNRRLQSVHFTAGAMTRDKAWAYDALGRTTNFVSTTIGSGSYATTARRYVLATDGTRLDIIGGANEGNYTKSELIPPGDAQMGQYTTWPHGPVEWTDHGELARLSQADGGSAYYHYDAFGRMTSTTNTTQPSRDHDSDGDGRIIQTTSIDPATGEAEITRFIYNGDTCIQEIKVGTDTAIVSRVASDGAVFGIITAGTNHFVHGGMNEPSAIKYPMLKGDYIRMYDADLDRAMGFRSGWRARDSRGGWITQRIRRYRCRSA